MVYNIILYKITLCHLISIILYYTQGSPQQGAPINVRIFRSQAGERPPWLPGPWRRRPWGPQGCRDVSAGFRSYTKTPGRIEKVDPLILDSNAPMV